MVIGSCGHQLAATDGEHGMGWAVIYRDHDKRGARALTYATVCAACRDWYRNEGLSFSDEAEADAWLTGSV